MDDLNDLLKALDNILDSLEKDSDYSDEPLPVSLCSEITCMGTPEDMSALIKAGYGSALRAMMVTAVVGNKKGVIATKKIPMVQVAIDKNGCVMHKEGKCLLWPSMLTPSMGKIHLLRGRGLSAKAIKFLLHSCVTEWFNPANVSDILFCLKSMERIEKDKENNHAN